MDKDFGDNSDSLSESKVLIEQSMHVVFPLLKNNSPVVVFFNPARIDVVLDAVRSAGFIFRRMMWMYKPNDVCFPFRGWLLTSEAILLFSKGELSLPKPTQYDHDCYIYNHGRKDTSFWHPSVKSLDVTQRLVGQITQHDDIVLDPFLGSGTTAVACVRTGRHFIGIEKNHEYCEIAKMRVRNEMSNSNNKKHSLKEIYQQ